MENELLASFREVNYHLRNTESKCLSVSISFIGLVTLIISMLYTNVNNFDFLTPNPVNILIVVLIAIIGCVVFILQKWFRVWKEHYMEICKNIVVDWQIDEKKIPYWWRKDFVIKAYSFDNVLAYFTSVITGGIFLLLAFNLNELIENEFFEILVILALILIYAGIFIFISKMITKEKCLDA